MDRPLVELARASGIRTDGNHEWPQHVDEDIAEFVASVEPRALFVVEQTEGLIIGPPPRNTAEDERVLVIAKNNGAIPDDGWEKSVVSASLPLRDAPAFAALHALLAQAVIPLFDAQTGQVQLGGANTARTQTRLRLVEAERALAQLLQHTQIAFVDLVSGASAQRARTALEFNDPNDLNTLQSVFNLWKQQITQLAASDRDVRQGSASDEMGFWIALEAALRNASEQLQSPLVRDVWQKLEQSKRFHATHNFEGDTGLKDALSKVQGYTQVLFRDLPLGELLAASSVPQLVEAMDAVSNHILRKLRASAYPAQRSIGFVEAIGRDFSATLLKLTEQQLDLLLEEEAGDDSVDLTAIGNLARSVIDASESWDAQIRDFSTFVRDLIRKRAERFAVVRVTPAHQQLVSRMIAIRALCAKHSELRPLLHSNNLDAVFNKVIRYPSILQLDEKRWHQLESEYSREAHAAEVMLADQLRTKLLEVSHNEPELLLVFQKHAAVLTRPQVRAVTHQFQTTLLDRARADLVKTGKRASSLQQIGPGDDIIHRVMRMRQLQLRTREIRTRLKIVLGPDWKEHSDGAQIGAECDMLEQQLNPEADVARWASHLNPTTEDIPVFRPENGKLVVNGLLPHTSTHIALRTLKALGFRFDFSTAQAAESLADTNVAVLRLVDSVATLEAAYTLLDTYPRINNAMDVSEHSRRIMAYIRTGLSTMRWTSEDLPQFVTGFEHAINLLDTRVTQLARADSAVVEVLDTTTNAASVISVVQAIDNILSSSIVSLEYSAAVRQSLTKVVTKKISTTIMEWEPIGSEHRIEIRSQQIRIVPDLSSALVFWYDSLNSLLKPAVELNVLGSDVKGYKQAVSRIITAWKQAQQQFAAWKALQPLWEERPETIPESKENGNQLIKFVTYLDDLCGARQQLDVSGPLVLDTVEARSLAEAKFDTWEQQLVTRLAQYTGERSTELVTHSRTVRRELESAKLDLNSLLKGIHIFSEAKKLLVESEHQLPLLIKANNLLAQCNYKFPVYWNHVENIHAEIEALQHVSRQSNNQLQEAKPRLLTQLEQSTASCVVESEQFKHKWQAERPLQAHIEPAAALNILQRFSADMDKLNQSVSSVKDCFTSLECQYPTSLNKVEQQLVKWKEELGILQTGWSELSKHWQALYSLGSTEFLNTPDTFSTDLSELKDLVADLPARIQQLQSHQRLEAQIDKIFANLPQIKLLRSSDAIQARHLAHLVPACGEHPLLKDLWTQLPDLDQVSKVVDLAEGEYQLLRYIDSVNDKWNSTLLFGQNNAVRNLDVVLTLTSDNLAAFSAMRSSLHFHAVAAIVQDWERRLGSAKQLFDKFVDAQQQFLYLRGVLTSPAVSSVLPVESRRFKGVADEFLQVYAAAEGRMALDFAGTPRIEANLSRLIGQFSSLHRSLTGFIETQRRRFPRLYFIGDDDLLEIVGNPVDIWGFKLLPSLFQGVSKLVKSDGEDNSAKKYVVSSEGETLEVELLHHTDNVEMLLQLDKQIKKSLKRSVFSAITSLSQAWPDPLKFGKWLESIPLQSALVALREQWSRTKSTESHTILLQWLSSAGDDSPLWMRRRECLVAELTHQLENEPGDLLVTVENVNNHDIMVKCGPCSLPYGFEFVTMEPVVRTSVTDDLFLSACAAIAQGKGGSIIGPAGTGKTESIKALGAVFGRNVTVINCDDAFDLSNVQRIITGCSATFSWACFDEFNRLTRQVLSSVAHTVSTSVKSVPVFVTMNPGYAGRTVLPANMRDEFREFVLVAPDAQKISRVLLYSHGKVPAVIADSVVHLLSVMEQKGSKQKHYDWGLRALKGVLRICRQLNGDMRRACEIAIRPRLLEQDVNIFDQELALIPQSTNPDESISEDLPDFSSVDHQIVPYVQSLYSFSHLFAGVMLLGPVGSGKTSVWRALAKVLNAETVVIDPSAVHKSVLLGSQDPLTREWTDGLLSRLLRRVNNNLRGEKSKTWFIVLKGEVEPQWAESLNSLLDDNRQLTLASGEILALPSNAHIIFEATNLDAATPATVSRCGMICLPPPSNATSTKIPTELLEVASQIKHTMSFIPCQAELTYNSLDLGSPWLSLAWSLAGDSDNEGRIRVSNAIRKAANTEEIPEGNLLNYYVSDLTSRWHAWQDCVEVQDLDSSAILRPDVVIPTADTYAHESLLQAALTSHRPLLLVGPPGSGKTMTLFNALRQIPQIALIALNFSSTAMPQLVIQALEMHCEYSTASDGSTVLSPTGSRWAALFIDEINLPQPNENGVAPVIQFLHFMVEFNGFCNSMGEFIRVERVQLVGACNPPPQRRALPDSFLRHFVVVNVQHPSLVALNTIYTAFMSTFDAQYLVKPMLTVYERLQYLEPGEIWTPRELTRWMRSIYTAYTATSESQRSQKLLKLLFVHEGRRVLADRLELKGQDAVLHLLVESIGSGDTPNVDGIWSYYISKRPKFVSVDELRQFVSARLLTFIEEAAGEGDQSLVVHDDFIKLISRIDRILRQHQGHGLIVGPPSVGKTTAIRFACWAYGLDLKLLRIHSQYGDADFAQDLRGVLLAALRRPLCLVLGEELLQAPEFVERMNSLLANGEVPGLFSAEHQAELEDSCRRAGFTGGGDLTPWFRQKVVANLHVMFTSTDLSRASPALLNRCTVIRVFDWSNIVKNQIAANWCSSIDAGNDIVQCLTEMPCNGGREFVELCYQFVSVYTRRKSQLEDTQRHFVTGGNKLKEALLEVAQLKRHLATQQHKLEQENAHSSAVLSQMLTEQSEAERKRSAAVEIRAAVQHQNQLIEDRRKAASNDLAAAEPLIAQAAQGVQDIKKAQLNELRSLANPPEPVKITLEAVCMLLGLKTDGSWKQVLAAVRGDEFISRIVHFDSARLMAPSTSQLVTRIENEYMSLPSFTYERVDRASKAGGPLLRWVVAQVAYARALSAVKPLMAEIEHLNKKSLESQAQLNAIEAMLTDLEAAIDKSKLEYGKAVAQCEVLKADMHNVHLQLDRAKVLLGSLGSEQERWSEGAHKFPENMSLLPGISLMEAAHLALGGPLDVAAQDHLTRTVMELGESRGLKMDAGNNATSSISRDDIALQTRSVALLIDPNNTWKASDDVKTTSFLLDPDTLLKELDTSLRFGQHLVIRHAERFDPLVVPLLNREFVRKGARLLVNFGNGDIDVAPGFKLTLHARDLNGIKRNSPLLLARVSVIDFRMTASVFEKMVGDALLGAKLPELAQRRLELHEVSSTTANKLRKLEQELLNVLSSSASSAGLLENQQLLYSLETLKQESVRLYNLQQSTATTLIELDEAYSKFAPTASKAAEVYMHARSYVNIDPFYVMGVDWLWQVAEMLVQCDDFSTEFAQQVDNRIASVVKLEHAPEGATRMSLVDIVREAKCNIPIIAGMTTPNAADPAYDLVEVEPNTHIVAMGSKQSATRADSMLDEAMEQGEWIVIQNAEIADEDWLKRLSRKLQGSSPAPNFRLIITGLASELVQIPDLVSSGRAVSIERAQGIRAQMLHNLGPDDTKQDFILNWIHSCFTEAFPPANFSKRDFEAALWLSASMINSLPAIVQSALLTTVWQAKSGDSNDKRRMQVFATDAFNDSSNTLPETEFKKWITRLPTDVTWCPKNLSH